MIRKALTPGTAEQFDWEMNEDLDSTMFSKQPDSALFLPGLGHQVLTTSTPAEVYGFSDFSMDSWGWDTKLQSGNSSSDSDHLIMSKISFLSKEENVKIDRAIQRLMNNQNNVSSEVAHPQSSDMDAFSLSSCGQERRDRFFDGEYSYSLKATRDLNGLVTMNS